MTNLEKFFLERPDAASYTQNYFRYLSEIFNRISQKEITAFVEIMLEARENERTIFFIGNGGSASTASHFANDLSIGTRTKNRPFKTLSLTDNASIITAIGNDFGYDEVFLRQLKTLARPEDVVVAISASGNSPNVIKAIEYANEKGCKTIGLTGFDGGKLRQIAQHSIHVPAEKGEYGPVEDVHMVLDHLISGYLMFHCRTYCD